MTREVTGDLLELFKKGHYDVIAHGCNCKGAMGAGIAKSIADVYPEVRLADKRMAEGRLKPWGGGILPVPVYDGVVINLYTQLKPGPFADMNYVAHSLRRMKDWIDNMQFEQVVRIGLPQIGCGIGDLKWKEVRGLIERTFSESRFIVDLVEYLPRQSVISEDLNTENSIIPQD